MKKVLVCALAALFLMASCLTAFAAEMPSYVTTTSYVTENDVTSLYVKTTVTGAETDTMLTYLAYTGASADDDSVVFIDQKTADGSAPVVFDYTTETKNLTGVTVKFGTSDDSVAGYPKTEPEADRTRVINVAVVDGGNGAITLPTEVTTGVYATNIEVTTGYTVETAVIGETNVANLIDVASGVVKVNDDAALVDGATITITLKAPYTFEPIVEETNEGRFTGFEGGLPVEKMTVFGKATADFDKMEEGFDWGGMLLSETNSEPEYGDADVTAYAAKFRGEDGSFAVQLVNKDADNLELTTKTWYARVYVRSTTGITYGPVVTFADAPVEE